MKALKLFIPPILLKGLDFIKLKLKSNTLKPEIVKVENGFLKGNYFYIGGSLKTYYKDGNIDQFIFSRLLQLNEENKIKLEDVIIWDIGSHLGFHTLTFSKIIGKNSKILAFEPNEANFERFKINLDLNPELKEKVNMYNYALSNTQKESSFVFSDNIDDGLSSGSHLKDANSPGQNEVYESFESVKLTTKTIDSLVQLNHFAIPNIIKIDVEGSESSVLKGGENLLKEKRPFLFVEIHHILEMHEILNFFLEVNYGSIIMNEAENSSSRCFLYAYPKDLI